MTPAGPSRAAASAPPPGEGAMPTSSRDARDALSAVLDGETCAICREPVSLRGRLDSCAHLFCLECIVRWADIETRCPLCKARFEVVQPERVASGDPTTASDASPPRARSRSPSPLPDAGGAGRLRSSVRARRPARARRAKDPKAPKNPPSTAPIRVARRDQTYEGDESELPEGMAIDDVICGTCGEGGDEPNLMLCDGCDQGHHCYCVGLEAVPLEEWFCRICERDEEEEGEGEGEEEGEAGRGVGGIEDGAAATIPGNVAETLSRPAASASESLASRPSASRPSPADRARAAALAAARARAAAFRANRNRARRRPDVFGARSRRETRPAERPDALADDALETTTTSNTNAYPGIRAEVTAATGAFLARADPSPRASSSRTGVGFRGGGGERVRADDPRGGSEARRRQIARVHELRRMWERYREGRLNFSGARDGPGLMTTTTGNPGEGPAALRVDRASTATREDGVFGVGRAAPAAHHSAEGRDGDGGDDRGRPEARATPPFPPTRPSVEAEAWAKVRASRLGEARAAAAVASAAPDAAKRRRAAETLLREAEAAAEPSRAPRALKRPRPRAREDEKEPRETRAATVRGAPTPFPAAASPRRAPPGRALASEPASFAGPSPRAAGSEGPPRANPPPPPDARYASRGARGLPKAPSKALSATEGAAPVPSAPAPSARSPGRLRAALASVGAGTDLPRRSPPPRAAADRDRGEWSDTDSDDAPPRAGPIDRTHARFPSAAARRGSTLAPLGAAATAFVPPGVVPHTRSPTRSEREARHVDAVARARAVPGAPGSDEVLRMVKDWLKPALEGRFRFTEGGVFAPREEFPISVGDGSTSRGPGPRSSPSVRLSREGFKACAKAAHEAAIGATGAVALRWEKNTNTRESGGGGGAEPGSSVSRKRISDVGGIQTVTRTRTLREAVEDAARRCVEKAVREYLDATRGEEGDERR